MLTSAAQRSPSGARNSKEGDVTPTRCKPGCESWYDSHLKASSPGPGPGSPCAAVGPGSASAAATNEPQPAVALPAGQAAGRVPGVRLRSARLQPQLQPQPPPPTPSPPDEFSLLE